MKGKQSCFSKSGQGLEKQDFQLGFQKGHFLDRVSVSGFRIVFSYTCIVGYNERSLLRATHADVLGSSM